MRVCVLYDTNYGNTHTIADLIAAELGSETPALSVTEITDSTLRGVDVLVVGSPINAWRPTEKIRAFLDGLAPGSLDGVRAAAFDTRMKLFHGDAAGKISHALRAAGATLISTPQGFIVEGTEGPLAPGQTDKARAWAAKIGAELRATA